MGDKITAKKTMNKLGVPCVPGSDGITETLEDAIKSKYKGSEETEVLLRNNLRLSDVLRWVKRL